jgi:hypothetical protein
MCPASPFAGGFPVRCEIENFNPAYQPDGRLGRAIAHAGEAQKLARD